MAYPATLIPGDGIGPEVVAAAVEVLDATGVEFIWDEQQAGLGAFEATGDPLPPATLASLEETRLGLKGPLTTPVGTGFKSINVRLRQHFGLFANVRPCATLPNTRGPFTGIDLVLYRENTEGLYSGIEHYVRIGDDERAAAESIAVITRVGSERIIRYAFEYALAHGRKKVTLVHKANILKFSQGLFRDVGREVAKQYEGRVAFDERIVDAMAMQLVIKPETFDVVVTTNLFGDILSDLISGLVGGLGLAPGANLGKDAAIFEAVHGTAPDIAGKQLANPGALIYAACLMLEHIGDPARATRIREAMEGVIREGTHRTRDLGGTATTDQFTDAIIARL